MAADVEVFRAAAATATPAEDMPFPETGAAGANAGADGRSEDGDFLGGLRQSIYKSSKGSQCRKPFSPACDTFMAVTAGAAASHGKKPGG
eukprot:355237-Chlamydomonas_euryale.AAC.15